MQAIMDELYEKNISGLRSIDIAGVVLSFYNTIEFHSASCNTIHVCCVVHVGESVWNGIMQSWIQDLCVLK